MSVKISKKKIKELAQKYNLQMLLLFGSQANGKVKPDSDMDIAYLAEKPLTTNEQLELNGDLTDLFRCDRVDQVNIKSANPLLLYEISRNSKLLFGKEIDYIQFKTRAFRIFIDSESLFRLQDVLIKKRHKFLGDMLYAK